MSLNQRASYTKNLDRLGKYFSSIDFEVNGNLTFEQYRKSPNTCTLGTLQIGNREFEMTGEELRMLAETCQRAIEIVNRKAMMRLM